MRIPKFVNDIEVRKLKASPLPFLSNFSRKVAANGAVLLKNTKKVLPFESGEKISIFGRAQFEYAQNGNANTEYSVNIYEGLKNNGNIIINEEVSDVYRTFIHDHPFDVTKGCSGKTWSQDEMSLTDEIASKASKNSDKALIVLSRVCADVSDAEIEGSYYLQKAEYEMIKTVCKYFESVCVALNIGSIIDFSWIKDLKVPSVIILWQGGQEGGNAAADIICGNVTPSGKLTDTIAKSLSDYPSYKNSRVGNDVICQEDIYVGYRYFETFAKNKVLYPFGFGLSYTKFSYKLRDLTCDDDVISFLADVTNVGKVKGAEVMQFYLQAPNGKIDRPSRELLDFAKTKVLRPGETCTVRLTASINDMAVYDASGITGNKSCYVLEPGQYRLCCGTDVRSSEVVHTFVLGSLKVVKELEEVMTPVIDFKRFKSVFKDETYSLIYEDVPQRKTEQNDSIEDNLQAPISFAGNTGLTLRMVADKKCSTKEFISQLTYEELSCLLKIENICNPNVKSGIFGAFGGINDELFKYGIPIVSIADGCSGMQFKTDEKATSLPIGTLLACTWDTTAVKKLYEYEAMEAFAYKVDCLLGPETNIRRHPLNSRSYDYFSEDPLFCGKMAEAVIMGLRTCNIAAVVKYFSFNNQSDGKSPNNIIVSERALREIYLKPFEILVESKRVNIILTSCNRTDGIYSAFTSSLNSTILRNEWGYDSVLLTDERKSLNQNGPEESENNRTAVSQNDRKLSLYDIQRSAENALEFLLETNAFTRLKRKRK